MSDTGYTIPRKTIRVTYEVARSIFYGTIGRADTVEDARAFIQAVRDEMPDATHHVYAFKVGYGASVTEGMSDDGEPSGTAGPPTLAVVRGADIGDVVLVVTRYYGGTKLGTGGLVRAYSQTAREALEALPVEQKIPRARLGLDVPYHLFEQVKRLIPEYDGEIEQEEFTADVLIILMIPEFQIEEFADALQQLSSGQISPTRLDE